MTKSVLFATIICCLAYSNNCERLDGQGNLKELFGNLVDSLRSDDTNTYHPRNYDVNKQKADTAEVGKSRDATAGQDDFMTQMDAFLRSNNQDRKNTDKPGSYGLPWKDGSNHVISTDLVERKRKLVTKIVEALNELINL